MHFIVGTLPGCSTGDATHRQRLLRMLRRAGLLAADAMPPSAPR